VEFATSPIQVTLVVASAWLAAVIGVLATLRRGHWLTTLVFSAAFLSMAAFQAGTLGILEAATPGTARMWATYLAEVSALASWLWLSLSVVLARSDPWSQIKNSAAYLILALIGCVAMSAASETPFIVREVAGQGGRGVIVLAGMGKIYLMYLVVVMVAVLMNIERTLRTAPAASKRRLRPMFLAFLVGILSELLVVSGGLLYGGVRVSWLAASAAPMFGAGVVTSFALARRRLSDMSVPLARPVIYYSSVSLTLAGAFLLTMAVLSKLVPILTPEWKRGVSLAFYLLAGGGGLLLTLSPRANRAVKRFIDRNFYANRYDYRREWERVTNAIAPSARPDDLYRQIETLMGTIFEAKRIALYLADERGGGFRRAYGPPAMPPVIAPENPLVQELQRSGAPVVFREMAQDLDLIPVAVENREAIRAVSAAVCASLTIGGDRVGLIWLSEKRNEEDYTAEDVQFLGAVSRQIAAALGFARQAEQLAETRQLESLHRLSSFVLHDIKNHVSGLSLVVENARQHLSDPEFQRDALTVLERTVANLRELMSQVSSVARPTEVHPEPCALGALFDDAVAAAGLSAGAHPVARVEVRCDRETSVQVDRSQMLRLVTNLLVNAREALDGDGEIELTGVVRPGPNGAGDFALTVRDSGRGMSEEFMRGALFRPFSTTKPAGLGIGLMQCRSIAEAHGGELTIESRLGAGTTVSVCLPAAAVAPGRERPA
jgi:putative PEP-CTERM system histidine kinase